MASATFDHNQITAKWMSVDVIILNCCIVELRTVALLLCSFFFLSALISGCVWCVYAIAI